MCGIAGVIGSPLSDAEGAQLAARMAAQLRHRGPDGAAYYQDDVALLVHTRLSIIDLAGGTQPIHNEDKSLWVTFNGEIFNYIELREELVARGHRFYTHSDTEVIVHLYEEYGQAFVQRLNGQFAIALWDARRRECLLVRDRVGIAPLYYRLDRDRLVFGSEIKAILETQSASPSLDVAALNQIFTFWTTLPSGTPFEGIRSLPPGCLARYGADGRFEVRTYWDHVYPEQAAAYLTDENQACETLRELLFDATRIRLRSDVPVGAYLSGGLDSSILAAVIRQFKDTRLSTFSISFADADHDEKPHQTSMVNFLGTKHRNVHCENQDIGERFLSSLWHMEFPVIRTAPVPMGILSGLAHDSGYKVVLTGEGADELFGGYDLFKETRIRQFWGANPASEWRPALLARLYPYLDLNQKSGNSFVRHFFGVGIEDRNQPLFSHLTRMSSTGKIKAFLSEAARETDAEGAAQQLIESLPPAFSRWHWLCKAQYLEIKTLMTGYLLTSQGDRMLMQHAVEGRFPFLDHRLMEFANRLHPHLKMKVLQEKYILRKAMMQYLPPEIAKRVKQPYRAPNIPAFFSAQRPEYVDALLAPESVRSLGVFDEKKVALLLKKVVAGRSSGYADNMAIVAILSTQAIAHLFIQQFGAHFGPGRMLAGPLPSRLR